jgi:hypothetical protein
MGIVGYSLGEVGVVRVDELGVVGVDVDPLRRRLRQEPRDVALAAVLERLGRRADRVGS